MSRRIRQWAAAVGVDIAAIQGRFCRWNQAWGYSRRGGRGIKPLV